MKVEVLARALTANQLTLSVTGLFPHTVVSAINTRFVRPSVRDLSANAYQSSKYGERTR